MNAGYSALVTGAVSIRNAGRSTGCAGRSLSSAHGSVDVPIVNGPAGHQHLGRGERRGPAAAAGACSTGGARAQLVGGQHRLVVLLLVLHDHAEREAVARRAGGPCSGLRSSTSSALSRTSAT